MSRSINTPTNQKRLTNVSIVKLSKGGKKFEIACYVNKVDDWRNGREKDLGEVLQVPDAVFIKVSKGEVAKKQILEKCFNTTDVKKIILEILNNGTLQLSEKERKEYQENLMKEIATIISEKCLDPTTNVQYTSNHILDALKKIHFSPKPNKNAKQQAVEAIKILNEHENGIKIRRANMKIKVVISTEHAASISDKLPELTLKSLSNEVQGDFSIMQYEIVPESLKKIQDLVFASSKKTGRVEILSLSEKAGASEVSNIL